MIVGGFNRASTLGHPLSRSQIFNFRSLYAKRRSAAKGIPQTSYLFLAQPRNPRDPWRVLGFASDNGEQLKTKQLQKRPLGKQRECHSETNQHCAEPFRDFEETEQKNTNKNKNENLHNQNKLQSPPIFGRCGHELGCRRIRHDRFCGRAIQRHHTESARDQIRNVHVVRFDETD